MTNDTLGRAREMLADELEFHSADPRSAERAQRVRSGLAVDVISGAALRAIAKALTPREPSDDLERVARIIADELGDDFDDAHDSKSHWVQMRGESVKGCAFRDVNAPLKPDYIAAAKAAIGAMGVGGGEDIRETLRQRALWVFQTYARCLVEYLPSKEKKYISVVEEFDKNIREAFWSDPSSPVDEGK